MCHLLNLQEIARRLPSDIHKIIADYAIVTIAQELEYVEDRVAQGVTLRVQDLVKDCQAWAKDCLVHCTVYYDPKNLRRRIVFIPQRNLNRRLWNAEVFKGSLIDALLSALHIQGLHVCKLNTPEDSEEFWGIAIEWRMSTPKRPLPFMVDATNVSLYCQLRDSPL